MASKLVVCPLAGKCENAPVFSHCTPHRLVDGCQVKCRHEVPDGDSRCVPVKHARSPRRRGGVIARTAEEIRKGRVDAVGDWLIAAWKRYVYLFGQHPRGTDKQLRAMSELESDLLAKVYDPPDLAAERDAIARRVGELERAGDAVRAFIRHKRGCQINPGGPIMKALGDPDPRPCSCGLAAALSAWKAARGPSE